MASCRSEAIRGAVGAAHTLGGYRIGWSGEEVGFAVAGVAEPSGARGERRLEEIDARSLTRAVLAG